MPRVLLVDDEPGLLYALKEFVRSLGHEPVLARSGAEALPLVDAVDAVVTDLSMPGMTGLELLHAIRHRDDSLPVIILTAHGSERIAVQAMKAGAYEYVTKPFEYEELSVVLERALESRALRRENVRLSAERAIGKTIVGDSPAMRRLLDAVARVAPKDITVLLRGETGTGKELVAALLHAESRRAPGPFVRFNCAAIPAELAEAELFGHTRGAFTGATQARQGFFAQAHGGTLLLDEVGEIPLGLQAKLLRALQEGEIQPVGAGRVERVDVRVVASTNRDLAAEAREGRFREDLYYRLAVVELVVPALREHREDIAALSRVFARRYADKFGSSPVRLSSELVAALEAADWPGNVRQLENTIARLVALASTEEIPAAAFTDTLPFRPAPTHDDPTDAPPLDGTLTIREHLEAVERNLIARTLEDVGGNQSETARRLGLSRSALIDRLKKYGLSS